MPIKLRDWLSSDLNRAAGCSLLRIEVPESTPSTWIMHMEKLRQPVDPIATLELNAGSMLAQQRLNLLGSLPSTGSRHWRAYSLSMLRTTVATESSLFTSSRIGPGLPKTLTVMSILLLPFLPIGNFCV